MTELGTVEGRLRWAIQLYRDRAARSLRAYRSATRSIESSYARSHGYGDYLNQKGFSEMMEWVMTGEHGDEK